LDGLVNGVVDRLAGRLNKPGIFILASPGCSRGRLVTVLLRRGLVDVVYAYGGFGSKVGDDVRGRVNEFGSIDELAGKLGNANGRVAVVARSTTDAIRLRNKLGNAEVIYLPKYYKDAAKEVLSGGAPEVAKVRHEGLGEGISPSMLREDLPSKDVESIRELSLGKVSFGDLIKDFLKKAPRDVAAPAITLGLSFLLGVGVAVSLVSSLAGRFLEMVVDRWRKNRDEVIGGFVRLLGAARKVNKNYLCNERNERLCDERFEAVFDEVAYEWGLGIEEFANTITNIANITEGKQLTEEDIKKIINDKLESIEKELNEVKTKVQGQLVDTKVFYIYDVENGLLYGNFTVEGGVPRIITWVGTAKDNLVTDLVDAGEFRKVAEEDFSKQVRGGRVVLVGPRGIGKSTLATYVAWRSLLGGLGSVVLDKSMDAVIRVDSLNPGDAARLNNLIEATGRRFVVIYDPSSIEAYIEPESMGETRYDVEGVKKTLSMLLRMRNAWVIIVLPRELYDEVSKDATLKSVLDEVRNYVINVDLKDEGFLREIVKRYSGCGDVSEHLVERIMKFDSYTLIAKYVGVWLRENKCQVKDIGEALRESTGKPKLFFAHYIWSTVLRGNEDLARRVSVPLILHAAFGPIPEGVTYITKAWNEGGAWGLVNINRLAGSKLEGLREGDLEPIAKWLSTLHEDLIEETLKDLVGLRDEEARNNYMEHGFENFINALDWVYENGVLSREVKPEKVVTNLLTLTGERLKHALKPYTNCWKRTAFIIGHALAGIPTVPRPEDLSGNVIESLGDALNRCGVDDYLLVGNKIPPLIMNLVINNTHALAEAFIDKYNEVVAEVRRVLGIARDRGGFNPAEEFYGLGLASIIANAAESGKPGDADAALHIASFAIQDVVSPIFIVSILSALRPLRGKAPYRYIELLASASFMGNLDSGTVRYIFYELNEILDNYGDVVRGYAWSLVNAIIAYAYLLWVYRGYFDDDEVKGVVGRVVDLLNELDRFKTSLGDIAWAHALAPALEHEYVRKLMMKTLHINDVNKVVDKANEVLGRLSGLREKVKDLMCDEGFMSYIESRSVKADEEAVKEVILMATSFLKHALAHYRLYNDELDEAEELFNETAKESREIGDYENYLISSGLVLRVEAIKDPLAGDKLVNGFRQLYEETFNKKPFTLTARYISIVSVTFGNYLVSLALTGNYEKINELLEEHWWVLNANEQASVLTRLMLNALLSHRGELSGELEGKLSVNPGELINAFETDMYGKFLPALIVVPGIVKPEDGAVMCVLIKDSTKGVRVVCGDSAIDWLRWGLVDGFRESLIERFGWLKGLGVNADKLLNMFDEFMKLVSELDGKSLVQLIAPTNSMALLALMLHALINHNENLAKAHALIGAVNVGEKLPTRLFLEAYKACCDLSNDEFRRAVAGLFFYHV